MGIIFIWAIGAFIIGAIGAGRKIGFFGAFFLSLFLSPLIGAIFVATSPSDDISSKSDNNLDTLASVKSDTAATLYSQGNYNQALLVTKEVLQLKPNDPYALMNAAKLYSLLRNKEMAFNSIHYAKRSGYLNLGKALASEDFNFIRQLPEYQKFVSSGYISPYLNYNLDSIVDNRKVGGIADELKKLADLKQAGVLTEEEFQAQKQRILNS